MPLIWKSCSLRGVGYRKLAFEFAAGAFATSFQESKKSDWTWTARNLYEHLRSNQYGPSVQNSQNQTLFLHLKKYYRNKKFRGNECLSLTTQMLQWFGERITY